LWVNDAKFLNGESNSLAEAVVIHFKENFLGDYLFKIPEMESFNNLLRISSRGILIKGEAKEKINALMKRMPNSSGLKRLSLLFSIFDILSGTVEYEFLASPGFVENSNLNGTDRLRKVIEYVKMNFDQDISLAEAAFN